MRTTKKRYVTIHCGSSDIKSNCKCIYCGKSVDTSLQRGVNWNVEHILPRVLDKWMPEVMPEKYTHDMLRKYINSSTNKCVVHARCNNRKGCIILKPSEIHNDTYVNKYVYKWYESSYLTLKECIHDFISLKAMISNRQDRKCYCCKKPINYRYAQIRRIDPIKNRSVDNACLMCFHCGETYLRDRNKINK